MSLGDFVALLAAVTWAGSSLLARALSPTTDPIWINVLRCAGGTVWMVVLLPWTLAGADLAAITLRAAAFLVLSTILGLGLGDTAFFESIRRLGVARATAISGSYPLLTTLLAVSLLDEPITPALVVGIAAASLGIWLVTSSGRGGAGPLEGGRVGAGLLLAALAAVTWAGSSVAVRPALETIDVMMAMTIRMPTATALLVLIGRKHTGPGSLPTLTRPILAWSAVAGLVTVVSTSFFLWAVALVGAARASALISAAPLFAAPLAVLLFHEPMTLRLATGIVVTVSGIALIVSA